MGSIFDDEEPNLFAHQGVQTDQQVQPDQQ